MKILQGDCLAQLRTLPACCIDAIVTDPPYELGFMGKAWDNTGIANSVDMWRECLRVLKPGGHLLSFGGSRTYHRMACAIEDAGFEIRDQIMWLYGSGFPKSLDVAKSIDKAARGVPQGGADPTSANHGKYKGGCSEDNPGGRGFGAGPGQFMAEAGEKDSKALVIEAQQWDGWGTALKPAHENLVLAQKPYDLQGICGILAQRILEGICQLPSLAKDVESSSPLSRSVFVAGFDSAQWSVVAECNTPGVLFDLTDTWPLGSVIPSSLSIGLLWLSILGAISQQQNMFTTEMKSSLTTDLKILNSLLSRSTTGYIIEAAMRHDGIESNASVVEHIFSAVSSRLEIIRALSAPDLVTLLDLQNSPVAGVRTAHEPICVARKSLEGTVAANVLKWRTGALNIDGCRVHAEDAKGYAYTVTRLKPGATLNKTGGNWRPEDGGAEYQGCTQDGRWPANLIHDGSEEVLVAFPQAPGQCADVKYDSSERKTQNVYGAMKRGHEPSAERTYEEKGSTNFAMKPGARRLDQGSAARFFYCAKPSKAERGEGNVHPTVKPIALMRYLCRLVTPPGGVVLDPFTGSGSTCVAAIREGFDFIGIELNAEYVAIARNRILKEMLS